MKISTNQFKNGTKLIIDNAHAVLLSMNSISSKGQAVMRIKYKNLITGNTNDKTFKSGESVEAADISHKEMEFLYHDNESWHFMDTNTYEQIEVKSSQMDDAKKWLVGQEICEIILWNDQPIVVTPPVIVELLVSSAEPGVKGDTVSGALKLQLSKPVCIFKYPSLLIKMKLLKSILEICLMLGELKLD